MSFENNWREQLSATKDCPSLITLLASSSTLEGHVAQCPHCQTELALFAQMEQPANPAAVKAISRRLERVNWANAGRTGVPEQPRSLWHRLLLPRFLAPASLALASALVLVTVVQVNRSPVKADLQTAEREIGSQKLRSQQLLAIAPLGMVPAPPTELRWEPVSGSLQYEVNLMEVDHATLWKDRVSQPSATVPASVAAKMLPGKKLLWEVNALDANGKQIASSGTLEFTTSLH